MRKATKVAFRLFRSLQNFFDLYHIFKAGMISIFDLELIILLR
jgi:hypothetical protein